jgi:hypothetical protein
MIMPYTDWARSRDRVPRRFLFQAGRGGRGIDTAQAVPGCGWFSTEIQLHRLRIRLFLAHHAALFREALRDFLR